MIIQVCETKHPTHQQWEYNSAQYFVESNLAVPLDPAISLREVYPTETPIQMHMDNLQGCPKQHYSKQSYIGNNLNVYHQENSSVKSWYIHAMEYLTTPIVLPFLLFGFPLFQLPAVSVTQGQARFKNIKRKIKSGRWPQKLESTEECVTTHLPNQSALKMDGSGFRTKKKLKK